jgi:hypothetical protein
MIDPKIQANPPDRSSEPKPGDFPIGSLESRAAARARLGRCNITAVIVSTGLPWPLLEVPNIKPPDTIQEYLAADDSIVEVICREYEPGRFSAGIHQAWSDGSEYHGIHLVDNLADLQTVCRPQPGRKQRVS